MNIFLRCGLRIIDDKLCCAGCIRETTQEIRFQTGSVSLTEAFNYLKADDLRRTWTEFPPAFKDFLFSALEVVGCISLAGEFMFVDSWNVVTCSVLGPDLCQLTHTAHWENRSKLKRYVKTVGKNY